MDKHEGKLNLALPRVPFSPVNSEGGELASLRCGVTRRGVTNLYFSKITSVSDIVAKKTNPSGISDHSASTDRWKNVGCQRHNRL